MSHIAKYIDHTALKPDIKRHDIVKLCGEAKEYQFASVCINPFWVKTAAELLAESPIKVCTVIGFPLGANTTDTKVYETVNAIQNGAEEIDMVINIGALKDDQQELIKEDIEAVVKATEDRAIVKVILEICLLTNEEIEIASRLSKEAGAAYVKTSTGFASGGATIEAVKLMRATVGELLGVKASGGIRDLKTAQAMIDAGASRIGASAGVAIVEEEKD